MQAVLVRNGEAGLASKADKEKLLNEYRGAYTTARTVDRKAVFELSMHCSRLHQTASAILSREEATDTSTASYEAQARSFLCSSGPEDLKPLIQREISTGLDFLQGLEGEATDDYQVTMLLTWDTAGTHTPDGRGFDLLTYVQPLPYVEPMVEVEAHRAERKNPTIKDVQWVSDRKHLEELQRNAGVNEVIMFDVDGQVTEGLQTNFFAIAPDGAVLTAPDERVLAGTVRKVVLEVAHEHGIPVRFECPNIHDLDTWESCFICSTSRLVKPIRSVGAPEFSARKDFPSSGSVAHKLEALVRDSVRQHSQLIRE